jgi:hypothetical protein
MISLLKKFTMCPNLTADMHYYNTATHMTNKKANTVVLWFTPPVKSLVNMASDCLGKFKDMAVLCVKLQTQVEEMLSPTRNWL